MYILYYNQEDYSCEELYKFFKNIQGYTDDKCIFLPKNLDMKEVDEEFLSNLKDMIEQELDRRDNLHPIADKAEKYNRYKNNINNSQKRGLRAELNLYEQKIDK